jgi:hypothetical protein
MGPPGEGPLPDRLAPGVSTLLEAFQYAHDSGHTVAEFAVEIERLEQLGLRRSELRWLICKNYVGHLVNATCSNQSGRKLHAVKALKFERHSCFGEHGEEHGRREHGDIQLSRGNTEGDAGTSSFLGDAGTSSFLA